MNGKESHDLSVALDFAENQVPPLMPPEGILGLPVKAVPAGWSLSVIPGWKSEFPARIKEKVVLYDKASFIEYVLRFRRAHTTLFGVRDPAKVKAVLDYHGADSPAWGEHTATLLPQQSRQWKAWTKQDGEVMGQGGFAEWVEDHMLEIIEPAGADLLPAIEHFSVEGTLKCAKVHKATDGTIHFQMADERKSSIQEVVMAGRLKLAMPVFENSTVATPLEARLRHRLSPEGSLSIWFDLVEPVAAYNAAVDALLKEIGQAVQLEPLYGELNKE